MAWPAATSSLGAGTSLRCRRERIAVVALLVVALRRLSRRSGVTDAEFAGQLPGDDLIPDPMVQWTRAVTLDSPPDEVWPWLAQMGFGRGGWYTSVLFDRLVWRLENPSVDFLIPEFQEIDAGDVIPDGPDHAAYFRVAEVVPEDRIVYRSIRHPYRGHPVDPTDQAVLDALEDELVSEGVYLSFTWAFVLRPVGATKTRLLVRTRADYSPKWLRLIVTPLGLVDFFHTRTMFSGISRRASGGSGRLP